jgi:Xaa-Pro dipeptidase
MLNSQQCRLRQQRALHWMNEKQLDAVVLGLPHHVYYLANLARHWLHEAALVIFADGRSWAAAPNKLPEHLAVDDAATFEAQWLATLRQEQPAVVAQLVVEQLRLHGSKRIGIDASAVTSQVALRSGAPCIAIDEHLWQQRRAKDPDEVVLLEKAVRCTEAMYRRAREIIEPGIDELEVFTQLNAAAVKEAGEALTALLGNDYACGVPGGPARSQHQAKDGELYILDIGPAYRHYFADNCRAFAVNHKPTDAQMRAWETIVSCFPIVESMAKPGARCRDIYDAVVDHMQQREAKLPHHLGHGVGLQPHEFPHLNPHWDDTLIEGEYFTVEPGFYSPDLAGGIRIENNYLVTAKGIRNLLNFPMDLA